MTFGLLPLGTNRVLLGFHQWALARGRYKCPLFRSAAALVSVGNRGMRILAPPNTARPGFNDPMRRTSLVCPAKELPRLKLHRTTG